MAMIVLTLEILGAWCALSILCWFGVIRPIVAINDSEPRHEPDNVIHLPQERKTSRSR